MRCFYDALRAAIRKFMDLKLSHKLLLGYLLIILLPSLIVELWVYRANYTALTERHIQNEESALQSSLKNLTTRLNQIQESARFAASNTTLCSYLSGDYYGKSEELYYYIRDVKPLLDYLSASDPSIARVRFHGVSNYFLHWNGQLDSEPVSGLPQSLSADLHTMIGGVWYKTPNQQEEVTYYRDLYTADYAQKLATMEITVRLPELLADFSPLTSAIALSFPDDSTLLERQNGNWIYTGRTAAQLTADDGNTPFSLFGSSDSLFVRQTDFPALDCTVYLLTDTRDAVRFEGATLLLFLLLIFCLMSLSYYAVTTSITSRITGLSRHIRHAQAERLTPYESDGAGDEIGQLTAAYNRMIRRINDLLYQLYHTELEKRDAQFYALQAQIEPHFLYNILENINMSAQQHGDDQTARMATALGKFMRYNLNNDTGLVPLEDELRHARNYLNIHQIRRQDKLQFQISVYTEIEDVECPRFLLQPLLENIFKHGIVSAAPVKIEITVTERDDTPVKDAGQDGTAQDHGRADNAEQDSVHTDGAGRGSVRTDGTEQDSVRRNGAERNSVRADAQDGASVVVVEIRDDGAGIGAERLEAIRAALRSPEYTLSSHVGLRNISNRLTACFGPSYGLCIDSAPGGGTVVTLFLKRKGQV